MIVRTSSAIAQCYSSFFLEHETIEIVLVNRPMQFSAPFSRVFLEGDRPVKRVTTEFTRLLRTHSFHKEPMQ